MLVSIALITLLPVFVFGSEDQLFVDIQRSVEAFERRVSEVYADTEACYPDIGCFHSSEGPLKHLGRLPSSPDNIGTKFYAFTQSSPTTGHVVDPHNTTSLEQVATGQLAIVTHGFGMNSNGTQLLSVKDSLLKYAKLPTVIMVDWTKGAKSPDYFLASRNTEVVGHQIAFLVETLRANRNIEVKDVHLIGFSLGAQVSGFAGKYSQATYKWTFGRISALDAAAPMFEDYPGSYLTEKDGTFVDAIHSSAGKDILKGDVGFTIPIGHVDFYPHNGIAQPRCKGSTEITCNHYSSVFYFEASLSGTQCHFTAYKCTNYADFEAAKCSTGGDSQMGYHSIEDTGRGSHYLDVTDKYPFCSN